MSEEDYPVQIPFNATPSSSAIEELTAEKLKGIKNAPAMDKLHGKVATDNSTPDIEVVPDVGLLVLVDESGDVTIPRVSIGDTRYDLKGSECDLGPCPNCKANDWEYTEIDSPPYVARRCGDCSAIFSHPDLEIERDR